MSKNDSSPLRRGSDRGEEFHLTLEAEVLKSDQPKVFQCTTDKAQNVLFRYGQALSEKNAWVAPLGLLLSCLATLLTTDFKDTLGLNQATWRAVFLVVVGLSILWLVRLLIRVFRYRKIDIDYVVRKMYDDSK